MIPSIEALTTMVPSEVVAMRGGRKRSLPATELVPGDVVFLESGDKIPADLRLIEARGLRVEEAALTGESVPVEKAVASVDLRSRTRSTRTRTWTPGSTSRSDPATTHI